jgi:hypothetical protein
MELATIVQLAIDKMTIEIIAKKISLRFAQRDF